METRPFGRTGVDLPILSLGCQRLVDEEGCSEEQAVEILNTAIDRGIRYFDTAHSYSEGQSERRVGLVARERRDEMWIASKTNSVTRDGAMRHLEETLERLQTDHLDEWRLHNLFDYEHRLEPMTGPGGALEALIEAREQGVVRFLSLSGHANPQVLIEALNRFPFDTTLVAVSALDHFIHSFAEEYLPVAAAKGLGIVGMKVFAYGGLVHVADRALRYSMGLPLTTVIAGCSTLAQLEYDLAVAESFVPMSGPERLEFFREIMPLVTPENVPWKAAEWGSSEWRKR